MMGGAGRWLLSLLAAAILCALAEELMPEGPVKRVGRMVCGLVLLCALLDPVAGLDLAGAGRWLEDYFSAVELREEELREQVDGNMKVIIEKKCAAYIADKAAELGGRCTVRVVCREGEGTWLPEEVWVSGALSPEQREALSEAIGQELGVPPERQRYDSGEGVP